MTSAEIRQSFLDFFREKKHTIVPSSPLLPDAPNVLIASPCSGHGFKFAPVIGEILAEMVTTGSTRHDISRFGLSRLASPIR